MNAQNDRRAEHVDKLVDGTFHSREMHMAVTGQEVAGTEQLVVFKLAQEELAVPIQVVQEIVRSPELTEVPNAPCYMEGIGNLRGNILPVANLRRRLGMSPKEKDENTRVVVLNAGGSTTGLVVDSVSGVISVEKSSLEPPPSTTSGVNGQFLKAIAKLNEGKRLVLILEDGKILPTHESGMSKAAAAQETDGNTAGHEASRIGAKEEEEQLVTFRVGQAEFAIEIERVQEIIRTTEITPVPQAPSYVLGVLSLRNHLLPIIDLRARFGLAESQREHGQADDGKAAKSGAASDSKIVVVNLDDVVTGIRVDSVSEVLRVPKSKVEPPPRMVDSGDAGWLKGVGKLNDGKRLIMLVDLGKLLSAEEREQISEATGNKMEESERAIKAQDEEEQLVCFRLAQEEYAISIMKVQEIIRVGQITALPSAPVHISGIINLRGRVLPVIDMRVLFSMATSERTEQNRIVVVDIAGKTTGLIVDSVSEVLRVAKSQIEPPPTLITGSETHYIDGVAKLQDGKRLITLIHADSILSSANDVALPGGRATSSES
jgi:purine-binding chemotaxis protein CheW